MYFKFHFNMIFLKLFNNKLHKVMVCYKKIIKIAYVIFTKDSIYLFSSFKTKMKLFLE